MLQLFLFICSIFLHIVDDFRLQGFMATMKQKSYWKDAGPKYRLDYVVALLVHGFSWAFTVAIPYIIADVIIHHGLTSTLITNVVINFACNGILHACIDDLKANRKITNLIQDQLLHVMQLIVICLIFGSYVG